MAKFASQSKIWLLFKAFSFLLAFNFETGQSGRVGSMLVFKS
jgi:hypothetical protein